MCQEQILTVCGILIKNSNGSKYHPEIINGQVHNMIWPWNLLQKVSEFDFGCNRCALITYWKSIKTPNMLNYFKDYKEHINI